MKSQNERLRREKGSSNVNIGLIQDLNSKSNEIIQEFEALNDVLRDKEEDKALSLPAKRKKQNEEMKKLIEKIKPKVDSLKSVLNEAQKSQRSFSSSRQSTSSSSLRPDANASEIPIRAPPRASSSLANKKSFSLDQTLDQSNLNLWHFKRSNAGPYSSIETTPTSSLTSLTSQRYLSTRSEADQRSINSDFSLKTSSKHQSHEQTSKSTMKEKDRRIQLAMLGMDLVSKINLMFI
jgi:hypothetical protein